MELSETTTLVLLFYSLSLLLVFAFPRVRTATPTSIVALLLFAPWTASLLAGALCETKIDTGCVELQLVEANSTLADQIIGFFNAEGKECVYHAKIPARCEAYFEAIDECPAERRRLDDGDARLSAFSLLSRSQVAFRSTEKGIHSISD